VTLIKGDWLRTNFFFWFFCFKIKYKKKVENKRFFEAIKDPDNFPILHPMYMVTLVQKHRSASSAGGGSDSCPACVFSGTGCLVAGPLVLALALLLTAAIARTRAVVRVATPAAAAVE
jgi:hypothetical protein